MTFDNARLAHASAPVALTSVTFASTASMGAFDGLPNRRGQARHHRRRHSPARQLQDARRHQQVSMAQRPRVSANRATPSTMLVTSVATLLAAMVGPRPTFSPRCWQTIPYQIRRWPESRFALSHDVRNGASFAAFRRPHPLTASGFRDRPICLPDSPHFDIRPAEHSLQDYRRRVRWSPASPYQIAISQVPRSRPGVLGYWFLRQPCEPNVDLSSRPRRRTLPIEFRGISSTNST